jgi:hypothetical protein
VIVGRPVVTVSVTVLVAVLTDVLTEVLVEVLVLVLVLVGCSVVVVVVVGASDVVVTGASDVPVGDTVTVSVASVVPGGTGWVVLTDADGVVVVPGEEASSLVNSMTAKASSPRIRTVAAPRPIRTAGLRCQGAGTGSDGYALVGPDG